MFSSAAEKGLLAEIRILLVDDEYQIRKVVHGLLLGWRQHLEGPGSAEPELVAVSH